MFGGKFKFNLGAGIFGYIGKAATVQDANCGDRAHYRNLGGGPSEYAGSAKG
ncbi:unannotated protein [freshwater metagenome]|uniref:Unannotated protein n=1 Tax=freshwater metagenome TaxID=449393 RepID=A0A6J6TRB9_9ZZZZ